MKKNKRERKHHQKNLYFTDKEWDILNKWKDKTNLSLSEVCYKNIFEKEPVFATYEIKNDEQIATLISQVRYVGRNFNQFMKKIYSKNLNYLSEKDAKDLVYNLTEIRRILLKIEGKKL